MAARRDLVNFCLGRSGSVHTRCRWSTALCSGETAVRYRIMGLYGSVVPARRGGDAPPLRYEGVSRRDARGRLTLVSDTPADTSLQQRLPKFLAPKDVWLSIFQGAPVDMALGRFHLRKCD